MRALKSIVLATVVASALFVASPQQAAASADCDVNPAVQGVSLTDLKNKSIVLNGNKVDVSVTVTGNEECQKTVSVASWQWPNHLGLPIKSQVLYKANTQTFGLGTHVISVEVPDCFWQVDLVEGDRPTAADGTADYQLGEPNDQTDRLMDAAYGGDKVCFADEKPAPQPVSPTSTPPVTVLPATGGTVGPVVAATAALSTLFGLTYTLIRTRQKS